MDIIIKKLLEIGSIKTGKFLLSSGKESNIYIDLRVALSFPDIYSYIVEESAKLIDKIKFDAIAGIPTGGLAWASFIAYRLKKPLVYIRKETKGHGTQKLIEGKVEKNSEILIVDDVATTGGNIFDGYEKLKDENYFVNYAFVIVDREEGAYNKLKDYGIELISLFKLKDILNQIKEII